MTGITSWLQELLKRRPAESATAAAGGLGLLLAALVGAEDDLMTGLVVLLAALPGVLSYLHDLGRYGPGGSRLDHDLTREMDELALRAARRARLGHEGWNSDVLALRALLDVRQALHPPPGAKLEQGAGSESQTKTSTQ